MLWGHIFLLGFHISMLTLLTVPFGVKLLPLACLRCTYKIVC